jgi:hypothetical protein
MFEDLWNSILELTSKFVIPDWGSVIAMLPVLVFAGAIVVIGILFWIIWRHPKPRVGKVKVAPVPPAGVHMPGPSWAPPLAALGAFMLFLGLVFGGPLLIVGVIGLTVTLLYWLAEAVRLYDHDLGSTVPEIPEVTRTGPPPGVPHAGSVVPAVPRRPRGRIAVPRPGLRRLDPGSRSHRADPDPGGLDGRRPGRVRQDGRG